MLNLTFIVVYIDCKKIYKHTTSSSGHVIIVFFILFFTFHRLYNTHYFILFFLKAIFHLEDLFTFKFRDSRLLTQTAARNLSPSRFLLLLPAFILKAALWTHGRPQAMWSQTAHLLLHFSMFTFFKIDWRFTRTSKLDYCCSHTVVLA